MKRTAYNDVLARAAEHGLRIVKAWQWKRIESDRCAETYLATHDSTTVALVFVSGASDAYRAQIPGFEITDCPTVDAAQTAAEVLAALEGASS